MDRISYSKNVKQTIYDIYRSCRLCGGGAGYKMPIVQNVIDLDTNGVELKQKIQECIQIEVHQDDKMPPLICELCVDKVNDFYEFVEMCRQTNKRTRLRLGLPLTVKKSIVSTASSDSGDCILGVTEPIHDPEDDNEPLSKQVKGGKKKEIKKEKDDDSLSLNSVKKKEEPLSKSVKKKEEPLPKSVKRKDELSKSAKKKDEPLSRSIRRTDDEPLSKTAKKKDEPLSRSIRRTDDEPLSKSAKKKDDEPLSKTAKKKEDEPLSRLVKKADDEPLSKSVKKRDGKKNAKDVRCKKETEVKLKTEKALESSLEVRSTRGAPPARTTRASLGDDSSTARSTKNTSKSSKVRASSSLRNELQKLLEDNINFKDDEIKAKRPREKEPVVEKKAEKEEVPAKKMKVSAPPKPPAKSPPKPKPKRAASPPAPPPTPPPQAPQHPCPVCGLNVKSGQGLSIHIRIHVVTFTNEKWACNPCGEWFSSNEETNTHHKKHKTKPYRCRHCYSVFKLLSDYNEHFAIEDCKPYIEVPDKKCDECWRTYPTQLLLDQHRCQGPDGRPGGKCMKCNRMYTLLKNLKKHEVTCSFRKKGEAIVDPEVERRLRDAQIHLIRCDDLLYKVVGDSYDVSDVDRDFGFDYKYTYPYRYRVKPEPNTGYNTMVAIGDEVKEHYSRNYVHWDSDDTDTDVDEKKRKIDSLTAITLKTIFSNKLLGKVPKRRRKVKVEKAFDDNDFDMSKDIDSIIGSLGTDDVKNKNDSANESDCSESIFGHYKPNDTISENAFDTLVDNDSQDTEKNFDLFNSSEENKDGSAELDKANNDSLSNDKENHDSQAVSNNSMDSGVPNHEDKSNEDCSADKNNDFEPKENDETSTDSHVNDNDENISQNTEISESENNVDDTNSDFVPTENYKTSTDTNKNDNDENISQNTEISELENNVDDTNTDFEPTESYKTSTDTNVNDNDENISQNTELNASQNEIDDTITESHIISSQNNFKENVSKDNVEIDTKEQISLRNKDIENVKINLDNNGKVDDALENNYDYKNDAPKETNKEANFEAVNGQSNGNSVNYTSDVDMDDNKLMDALDEQIGEKTNGDEYSSENRVENDSVSKVANSNDFKIVNSDFDSKTDAFNGNVGELVDNCEVKEKLSDVVSKGRSNLSGMDLDNVSDEEFNFDM